ncbi:glycosyltransferase family 4 protein [Microbacterium profundi]|uniref:glycosyltransferase family 4 protein n=1 Tax=Microbacterium profundi TaxID=450380 RepID=UPI001F376E38|nr:glycosyltransferase family 1 protein [Microbacterium profundi]MCE7481988.1 glycosyltransferase family 4 protein [Microbacterium profundi]
MSVLVVASTATSVPMGAQEYQEQITTRAASALNAPSDRGDLWSVERLIFRSMRSSLNGNRRVPLGWLNTATARQRRVVGSLVYPRHALLHRMELGLPPGRDEILTMHDTVAWRYDDEADPPAHAAEELRAAAAVICVSQYTADDVSHRFGLTRVHVAHLGIEPRFWSAEPLSARERADAGIPRRFILHAGGATARKNLEGLASAWAALSQKHSDTSLVLAGPDHPRRTSLFGGMDRARMVGRVSQELLPRLMASAEAVIVPSHDEGFGLPVLEAMAAGVPVIVARTSSLVEVAGPAGILVGTSPGELAEGIDAVLEPGFRREQTVASGREWARGFTWERSAAAHAEVWRAVGS